jgi:type VI protein secretion system component VasF
MGESGSQTTKGSLDLLMSEADDESSVQWIMKHRKDIEGRQLPRWRRITVAELLLITLILLVAVLISITLALEPTDQKCARRLSVYCEAETKLPRESY